MCGLCKIVLTVSAYGLPSRKASRRERTRTVGDRAKIAMRVSAAGEERGRREGKGQYSENKKEGLPRKIGYESKIEGKIGLREVAGKKEILQSSSRRARRG